ncbi:hypothetical protein SBA7_590022 [Candidatus Sulfotelmatobacter sp. SbA7]|nr:hypothetical protein SBA7_590022 [Candidatus Sulfotelmatobacter sp. SbA7]
MSLTKQQALEMFRSDDLIGIGREADAVRHRHYFFFWYRGTSGRTVLMHLVSNLVKITWTNTYLA